MQGELEAALDRLVSARSRVTGAGRTDSGVHALGQVISFAAETRVPPERMALALNSLLPADVTVRQASEADPEFNARFSASSRIYAYLILNRAAPSALLRRYSAFCPQPLDTDQMEDAAGMLLGEQDFAAFANELQPDEPTCREMLGCRVRRRRDMIVVRVEANAFLRGMVRTLVGTLLEVGAGRREAGSLPALLASRDRRLAGPCAPPQGLTLLRVKYGERKIYARRDAAAHAAVDTK